MYAVVFEVLPSAEGHGRYLDLAAALRPRLDDIDGFLSIERFNSLSDPGWILSLSFWRDEAALLQWRGQQEHHAAQAEGRHAVFDDYRLRVLRMDQDAGTEGRVGVLMRPGAEVRGRRFSSLAEAGKLIDLFDTDGGSLPAGAMSGFVLRDYGMRERAQAPQFFPAADKRRN